jgi:hypothetical protein
LLLVPRVGCCGEMLLSDVAPHRVGRSGCAVAEGFADVGYQPSELANENGLADRWLGGRSVDGGMVQKAAGGAPAVLSGQQPRGRLAPPEIRVLLPFRATA